MVMKSHLCIGKQTLRAPFSLSPLAKNPLTGMSVAVPFQRVAIVASVEAGIDNIVSASCAEFA